MVTVSPCIRCLRLACRFMDALHRDFGQERAGVACRTRLVPLRFGCMSGGAVAPSGAVLAGSARRRGPRAASPPCRTARSVAAETVSASSSSFETTRVEPRLGMAEAPSKLARPLPPTCSGAAEGWRDASAPAAVVARCGSEARCGAAESCGRCCSVLGRRAEVVELRTQSLGWTCAAPVPIARRPTLRCASATSTG